MLALLVLLSLSSSFDAGAPVGVRCAVGADAGVVSVAWSTLPDAKQIIVLSPSLRVLWVAYPGDPPAPPPEVTCLDGGLALTSPLWMPFRFGFEEGGERLRVDLRPAHDVLEAAFARLPGDSLTDATALTRAAMHTAYVLRRLAEDATAALQIDARDLELRERAWDSRSELASALQFLSQTPRGRAIAEDVEERLVRRAPFVMRDLHQLEFHQGASRPVIFWRAAEPCVAWAGTARCTDLATGSSFSTRGLARGTTVKLVHTPPSTMEGDHDEASATVVQGDRQWDPSQLIVSARGGTRFSSAPAEIGLAPSDAAGVVLVPVYGGGKCKPRARTIFSSRFSCEATFLVESWEVWTFSTRQQ